MSVTKTKMLTYEHFCFPNIYIYLYIFLFPCFYSQLYKNIYILTVFIHNLFSSSTHNASHTTRILLDYFYKKSVYRVWTS